MLTVIKAFSALLNDKASHLKKGCENLLVSISIVGAVIITVVEVVLVVIIMD
jgi:hypothetical protein